MFFRGKNFSFEIGTKTYVMGILNVTPDSFSDGGKYFDAGTAVEHALQMEADGADIIDIGGQSTRPGIQKISEDEEKERLQHVITALKGKLKAPISVDTFYPSVAAWALQNGASIINDVSGTANTEMFLVVKEFSAGYIIMHSESTKIPVKEKLFSLAKAAEEFGIEKESICLDIGLGFDKDPDENNYLVKNLKEIKPEGYPMLVAASRKRFIGEAADEPIAANRDAGTIAVHTIAIAGGADLIRVHNVKAAVQAVKVADRILRS